jgi:hypothetical protein
VILFIYFYQHCLYIFICVVSFFFCLLGLPLASLIRISDGLLYIHSDMLKTCSRTTGRKLLWTGDCNWYIYCVGGLNSRVTVQVMHSAVVRRASEMAKATYITWRLCSSLCYSHVAHQPSLYWITMYYGTTSLSTCIPRYTHVSRIVEYTGSRFVANVRDGKVVGLISFHCFLLLNWLIDLSAVIKAVMKFFYIYEYVTRVYAGLRS